MNLRAYLEQAKISAAAFAPKVGVPNRQTMSRYVRGDRVPPPEVIVRIEAVTKGEVTWRDLMAKRLAEVATAGAQ